MHSDALSPNWGKRGKGREFRVDPRLDVSFLMSLPLSPFHPCRSLEISLGQKLCQFGEREERGERGWALELTAAALRSHLHPSLKGGSTPIPRVIPSLLKGREFVRGV